MAKRAVVRAGILAEARLAELGPAGEVLRDSLRAGLAASALTDANHPPNYAGTVFWAETVRALRDALIPEGWRRDNSGGFATVVRPDGLLAIAVARGNESTGEPDPRISPTTQYARGPVTERAVSRNRVLPFEHLPPGYDEEPDATPTTWLLLHHQREAKLHCELSCPISIASGFVNTWSERIILTPIGLGPEVIPILEDEPVSPIIEVKRRG